MEYNLKIVGILTIGFALASILGYFAQKIKFPSILGYLIAGYFIGPFSPGFVADIKVAEELAAIGVILMLFGVGLHFKIKDLLSVKHIAIPGAIIQVAVSAAVTTFLVSLKGWPIETGVILGLAIGVASTVVLVRMLTDYHIIDTFQGHLSLGWLIVEDMITVLILVMLPLLAEHLQGEALSLKSIAGSISLVLIKFALLLIIMFKWGDKVVAYLLTKIAKTGSHELFTLSLLSIIFLIATGAYYIFGITIALGAFIAGMVIGKTHIKHQAAANASSLKDIFAIIFFLSVGMLFNPMAVFNKPELFLGAALVILIVKPLTAFIIVKSYKYSTKIALTLAIALAQIGEFSFILTEEAMSFKIISDDAFDILVAAAFLSIAVNPLLFKLLGKMSEKKRKNEPPDFSNLKSSKIIVVGFGPIGQEITNFLMKKKIKPLVIEQNIDTVTEHEKKEINIIFGDAAQESILESAKVKEAALLILTIPNKEASDQIMAIARRINPKIFIIIRVLYQSDLPSKKTAKIQVISSEKETAESFKLNIEEFLKNTPLIT